MNGGSVLIEHDRQQTASPQRVIGMIGGMSWESTARYFRLANEEIRERFGGLRSARLVLTSVDFAETEALQVAGEWDRAAGPPRRRGRRLEAAGGPAAAVHGACRQQAPGRRHTGRTAAAYAV
jgi:hypothetical protein